MKISAKLDNTPGIHNVIISTNGNKRSINIPPKDTGHGSDVNGGELLFLALATCYCNDIYREAGKRSIKVNKIEVEVNGEFGGEGEPARNIIYSAKIAADAGKDEIRDLMHYVDKIAEIHNTLRIPTQIKFSGYEILKVNP